MNHELHPAGLIEEPLGHYFSLARECTTQSGDAGTDVERGLFCAPAIERTLTHKPFNGFFLVRDRSAHVCDFFGQLDRASGRLAAPEGN